MRGTVLDPAMLLALDEAFLMGAESGEIGPSFRTWEFPNPTVVLGRSSKADRETDREHCDRHGIGIYRRCSGGASIVGGPGCLMYSVVLSLEHAPHLAKIDEAHTFVMQRVLTAAQRQLPEIRLQGICDLTWRNRKFSGNALRITRSHVLYHGTVLYAADLENVARCLAFAPRQPDYRDGRDHQSFITNVPLNPATLADDLAAGFDFAQRFDPPSGQVPEAIMARAVELVSKRYSCEDWRFRH
ncbi:putative lipoate-protein ligase A [Stieleria neptunia]|uniref:Putative lipoate-protein ligase A n=1 Tax=Stieleria neptunia TaxID=2527979 RepID=A0A518HLA0_9BACT|nr:putative lipoate-protein ligase A [Stieleria neptunia]